MSLIPIVGAYHRPPAQAILGVLPTDHPLWLVPEPENPYDSNAIRVVVETSTIPAETHDALGMDAQGYGYSLEDILAAPAWHLGYIPRDLATHIAPRLAGRQWAAQLRFTASGKPALAADLPETQP